MTSSQGEALRDILKSLGRGHHSANVLIYPAQVQGDSAPGEVMAGLRYFHQALRHQDSRRGGAVEVIIIARGGGSAEDLAGSNHDGLPPPFPHSKFPSISPID